jgi:chromosome segregation ATPase
MLLVRADQMMTAGEYGDALEAYGEILAKYPDADEARRARGSREAIAALLAARAQVARLTADMKAREAELARTREHVAARDHDVARAREHLAARDGDLARARQEITRLTAEADRLRADLETLKKIDIDLERRRK